MKTSSLIAAVALSFAASGAAWAQQATYEYPQSILEGKTRAEVRAELIAARADGSIKVWSTSYNPLAVAKSQKSREQVQGERHSAQLSFTGEDSGSFALSSQQPAAQAPAVMAQRTR